MTKDLCQQVTYADLTRAYGAYSTLMSVYENTCGGPYRARAYKEYFAIIDSRDNIRQEVMRRAEEERHG